MAVIGRGNGIIINSIFGREVSEGTVSSGTQGAGRTLTFTFEQSPVAIRSVYVQIVPIIGSTGDFWDNFWSNNLNGEPADQFALSNFVSVTPSGEFSVTLNADNRAEPDQVFEVRVYESNMDAAYGYAPMASSRFTVLDDDVRGLNGDDALIGRAHAEILQGFAGNDTLNGGLGDDWLLGGAGNDILNGGAGNDTLDGGAGTDWVSFMGESRAARVDLAVTGSQATGHGFDVIRNIENIHGGAGNDILLGNAQANLIRGGNGADNIQGRQGYDLLEGNAGNDTLNGGAGNDTLDGGAGTDWVSFMGESRAARVDLAVTGSQATGHGFDVIRNIENIHGGAGNDILLGNAQANLIRGGNGADNIQGRQGYDLLEGNAGNDTLNGGFGNDTLIGGVGNDQLRGASGTDTFVFRNGFDRDVVLDFQDNIDTIRLLDFGVSNFAQARTYAAQSGSNVVFDFGDGDILTVRNTTLNALGDDLIFI